MARGGGERGRGGGERGERGRERERSERERERERGERERERERLRRGEPDVCRRRSSSRRRARISFSLIIRLNASSGSSPPLRQDTRIIASDRGNDGVHGSRVTGQNKITTSNKLELGLGEQLRKTKEEYGLISNSSPPAYKQGWFKF